MYKNMFKNGKSRRILLSMYIEKCSGGWWPNSNPSREHFHLLNKYHRHQLLDLDRLQYIFFEGMSNLQPHVNLW